MESKWTWDAEGIQDVPVTVTVTMPFKKWIELRKLIKDNTRFYATHYGHWPVYDSIVQLMEQVNGQVWHDAEKDDE